jgi:hypothetical protein
MLSNFEIDNICNQLHIPLRGVFMKDELPNECLTGHYIINLQSESEGNGTHWLSLTIYNQNAYHFDSFGVQPNQEVIEFCKKGHCKLGYNTFQIQNINSELCGWYCIANLFVLQFCGFKDIYRGSNLFINLFSKNTIQNGNILKHFYKTFCGKITNINKLNNSK